jgi:catechol 2,3-dioxygenase-like lactoylglutathione lyase family enzyme
MRTTELESPTSSPTIPQIEASLWEIVLTSPDVDRLSDFYTDALGYSGTKRAGEWTGRLGARRLAICEGPANAIAKAVFALSDDDQLASLEKRLRASGQPFVTAERQGLRGNALEITDPDGNRLLFGVADEVPASGAEGALTARLQHIVFASDQVGAMLDFYRDVIGFVPSDFVFDSAEDLTSAFLRCSKEHHSLAIFRASRRRLDHFCFDVEQWDQIRDWADRFAERHIPLTWGPGRHGPGNNLFLFVKDPDGNWLEFSAELERIDGAHPAGRWVHEERTLNSWGTAFLRS